MKLSLRTEYAILALLFLARNSKGKFLSAETISKKCSIPYRFLEQILASLKRAKYLKSVKGQKGGYCLSKSLAKISIAEIIRLFDGPLAPTKAVSKYFYHSTPIEKEEKLLGILQDIRDSISKKLESTNLKKLL